MIRFGILLRFARSAQRRALGMRALAVIQIAAEFRDVFGTDPSWGTNSPFFKFCSAALPEFGFDAPSSGTVRGWISAMGIGRKTKTDS